MGRYRIVGVLGEGGMGVVYRAYDDELSRAVALKLIRPQRAETEAAATRARGRMVREARAMAQLSHPNVVQIYDVGEHQGELFMAMELVEGTTLGEWVARLGPPAPRSSRWREIVGMFVQAARGLAAAHAAGLVHRDFKPANVLVGVDGQARVGDFGLARAGAEPSEPERSPEVQAPSPLALTKTGALLGTPAYCSPEQLRGQRIDARSDQFSLCVALHEALFGRRPFAGDSVTEIAVNLILGERRDRPADVAIPGWLAAVLDRGLTLEAEERWPSMDALIDALLDDPARRRRRWIALGSGGLLCAVIATGYVVNEAYAQARCEATGDQIDEVWSERVHVTIDEAFAAAAASDAGELSAGAGDLLDAWAERWRDARVRACLDARVEAELAEPRESCLGRQYWHLEALLDVLATADRATVFEAIAAAQDLPPIERCTDPAWLAAEPAVTGADERARVRSEAVRRDLARVFVLERLGRYDEAIALSESAQARARALDDLALEAEALAKQGKVHSMLAEDSLAQSELVEAYFLAGRVAHDRLASTVALDLAFVVGVRLARPDQGQAWLDHAGMNLERMGLDLARDEPDLFVMRGELEEFRGHYAEALEHHQRGLALRRQTLGSSHPEVADSLFNIGTIHTALGSHPEALAVLREGRTLAEYSLGSSHRMLADFDDAIGQALAAAGRPEDAIGIYRRSLAIRERALGPDNPVVGTSLSNLGAALYAHGDREQAAVLLARALDVRERATGLDDPDTLAIATNLARIRCHLGEFSEASLLYARVLEHGGLDVVTPRTARIIYSHASCLARSGDHQGALAGYQRALSIDERVDPDHPEVAADLDSIGREHLRLGRPTRALEDHERAAAIRARALDPQDPKQADSLDAIGAAALALGQTDRAVDVHRRALEIRTEARGPHHPSLATTLTKLGLARAARGEHQPALGHFERALEIVGDRRGDTNALRLARALEGSARSLVASGRTDEAARRLERAIRSRERTPVAPDALARTRAELARLKAELGR